LFQSTKTRRKGKHKQTYATLYKQAATLSFLVQTAACVFHQLPSLHFNFLFFVSMAPKPASTAGKAPASTASKAPAKSTEGAKAAKKTSKAAAPADGEKKKRKKVRKETYSSYIYKGQSHLVLW